MSTMFELDWPGKMSRTSLVPDDVASVRHSSWPSPMVSALNNAIPEGKTEISFGDELALVKTDALCAPYKGETISAIATDADRNSIIDIAEPVKNEALDIRK